jgi:predicted nucleic acid-binding protein
MYRPQGNPTVEQVEDFEAQLTEILQDVMNILDFDKERAQFEAAVYEQLQHKGLLKDWKPPVWIHKSSII